MVSQFPRMTLPILLFLIFLWPPFVHGTEYQVKVIHISDGDTITVLNKSNEEIKIRLNGIDCPEKGQAFGTKAKQFVRDLVIEQPVTVQPYKQDKYGRTIADVILTDGRNLSRELVKAGYAWWFFKYSNDEQLGILEVKAKIEKRGLWADRNPIPPWIFRHQGQGLRFEPSPQEPSSRQPFRDNDTSSFTREIRGNKRSHKYHRPDCPNYDDIAPQNLIIFQSEEEAKHNKFTLAGNCP